MNLVCERCNHSTSTRHSVSGSEDTYHALMDVVFCNSELDRKHVRDRAKEKALGRRKEFCKPNTRIHKNYAGSNCQASKVQIVSGTKTQHTSSTEGQDSGKESNLGYGSIVVGI